MLKDVILRSRTAKIRLAGPIDRLYVRCATHPHQPEFLCAKLTPVLSLVPRVDCVQV